MKTRTYFVVRAVIANPDDRAEFDRWYQDEHLPDAMKAFGVTHAFRAWNRTDPSIHCAFYEFPSVAAAEALGGTAVITSLIEEFDRHWAGKVTRSREIFEVMQEIG
jgi:hypothetical protein